MQWGARAARGVVVGGLIKTETLTAGARLRAILCMLRVILAVMVLEEFKMLIHQIKSGDRGVGSA